MGAISRVFLDTDFLIDAFVPGRPQAYEAGEVFRRIGAGRIQAFCMVNQLVDFYCVSRKGGVQEAERRRAVSLIAGCCTLFQPDLEVVRDALSSSEPDFEDGLIRSSAERVAADCIASRDAAAFKGSAVAKMEPRELLQAIDCHA